MNRTHIQSFSHSLLIFEGVAEIVVSDVISQNKNAHFVVEKYHHEQQKQYTKCDAQCVFLAGRLEE